MLNNLQQVHLKLFQKKSNSRKKEASGVLIGHKIADKSTRASRTSQQNNSEKGKNEHYKKRKTKSYI